MTATKDHDTTNDLYQVRQYTCYKKRGVILLYQLKLIGCDMSKYKLENAKCDILTVEYC
jgi:hypothetical protein